MDGRTGGRAWRLASGPALPYLGREAAAAEAGGGVLEHDPAVHAVGDGAVPPDRHDAQALVVDWLVGRVVIGWLVGGGDG